MLWTTTPLCSISFVCLFYHSITCDWGNCNDHIFDSVLTRFQTASLNKVLAVLFREISTRNSTNPMRTIPVMRTRYNRWHPAETTPSPRSHPLPNIRGLISMASVGCRNFTRLPKKTGPQRWRQVWIGNPLPSPHVSLWPQITTLINDCLIITIKSIHTTCIWMLTVSKWTLCINKERQGLITTYSW